MLNLEGAPLFLHAQYTRRDQVAQQLRALRNSGLPRYVAKDEILLLNPPPKPTLRNLRETLLENLAYLLDIHRIIEDGEPVSGVGQEYFRSLEELLEADSSTRFFHGQTYALARYLAEQSGREYPHLGVRFGAFLTQAEQQSVGNGICPYCLKFSVTHHDENQDENQEYCSDCRITFAITPTHQTFGPDYEYDEDDEYELNALSKFFKQLRPFITIEEDYWTLEISSYKPTKRKKRKRTTRTQKTQS